MKGVVNPQQAPTMRNPITHRHIAGDGAGAASGESGSIVRIKMMQMLRYHFTRQLEIESGSDWVTWTSVSANPNAD